MSNRSRMRLFSALGGCILGMVALSGSMGRDLRVPADKSLSSEKYVELGVPDPRLDWGAREFEKALGVLGKLDYSELPRSGSARSGEMFSKLLKTQADLPRLLLSDTYSDEEYLRRARGFRPLYESRMKDGWIFDRELLEIVACSIQELIRERAKLKAISSEAADVASAAMAEGIVQMFFELFDLGEVPGVSKDGRHFVASTLCAILPGVWADLDVDQQRRLSARLAQMSTEGYKAQRDVFSSFQPEMTRFESCERFGASVDH